VSTHSETKNGNTTVTKDAGAKLQADSKTGLAGDASAKVETKGKHGALEYGAMAASHVHVDKSGVHADTQLHEQAKIGNRSVTLDESANVSADKHGTHGDVQ